MKVEVQKGLRRVDKESCLAASDSGEALLQHLQTQDACGSCKTQPG